MCCTGGGDLGGGYGARGRCGIKSIIRETFGETVTLVMSQANNQPL